MSKAFDIDNDVPSAFFQLQKEAAEFGFDQVLVILTNTRTGDAALRTNAPLEDAVLTMEEITAETLDELAARDTPLKSLRRKDIV